MSMQSQDIIGRSATAALTPAPRVRDHKMEIAKLIDVTTCIGCKACQVACSEWNDIRDEVGVNHGVYDNPIDLTAKSWTVMRFAEHQEEGGRLQWLIRKDGCMHCADPGCMKACPAPGAIIQYANGVVDFQSEHCIGCGYCIAGCPFNVPRINKADNKAYKCTLCSDRLAVGQEPSCVKTCPTGAIQFGTKEDMKLVAAGRVADLQSRGFGNAGLYDPQGVGGTHVMYVLHHADRPQLYNNLPSDPQISPTVNLWKGMLKPLATIGIAAAGLFGFFHYTTVGPNRADEEEEEGEAHGEHATQETEVTK
ncbi:formate dehydrogenase subunit beta [Pseudothauera nasutitermitis]|uniref:Formate dehydrogenase subunit beta n=1 Tax=Pseudothauera nasutitermitis TaxID=2565930 RepID=A0A4S4AZF7_9RHOO|nr:formate dehydrogenase subunit beta [Pseudothauera nasutitermitis]THF65416.1 formate dehydrogenase subunit beta [Pseudothauera nasutitermitis]